MTGWLCRDGDGTRLDELSRRRADEHIDLAWFDHVGELAIVEAELSDGRVERDGARLAGGQLDAYERLSSSTGLVTVPLGSRT